MPAFGKMSDEKNNEIPVIVTQVMPSERKPRNTKKYVIIAVSGILAAAIILTAILVGMYMFTEAQKDIIQYTLKMSENMKQDVTSDPNENVVTYHISNPAQETWIVNDFGKDLQVVKIKGDDKTNCFVSPLNRTNLLDPAKINGPDESPDVNDAVSLTYMASDTPVSDTSFLGKTAKAMCKGVSVYWLYPHCIDKNSAKDTNVTEVDHPKSKRQTNIDYSPFYIRSYLYYYSPYTRAYYYVPCFTGCCRRICACSISYAAYYSGGRMYCSWYYYRCPAVQTVWDSCTSGPRGLRCPNYYPTYPPYC
jgi:hypothetical protein